MWGEDCGFLRTAYEFTICSRVVGTLRTLRFGVAYRRCEFKCIESFIGMGSSTTVVMLVPFFLLHFPLRPSGGDYQEAVLTATNGPLSTGKALHSRIVKAEEQHD